MDEKKYISELDTLRFGFKIAKVNNFDSNTENQIYKLKKFGVKLIISRINSRNINLINELEDLNFRIKDTQLTFSHDLKNIDQLINELSDKEKENVLIQEAQEADTDIVGKIAYNAFRGYGHYAADNRMDSEKSNEIYRDWAQKSCIDKSIADYMFIAKINSQIAGFLSLKINRENENVYGIQHLGAVDENYRNFSVFRLLILKCLLVGIEKNHDWQQTFLLSTNIPVIRSYFKMGFKISDSNHTMHCWL